MFFTSREKGAIVYLVGVMACADGKVVENEKNMMALVSAKIGVDDSSLEIAQSMREDEALDVVVAMTAEEKRFVCAALGSMMLIDGDVDDRERFVWNLISHRCQFPRMTVMQAAEIFRSYL